VSAPATDPSAAQPGTVYLAGAGPGDGGLMTRRTLELVASADAVLYDRLIPADALDGARSDALLIYAGKGPHGDSKLQGSIEDRMIELAQAGKSVVRLKGGDPFVFGRGAEEAARLRELGIPFEIVPGVTAGVAASAYAGVPVTHRDHAAAVAFVTGTENPDKSETALDWNALAAFPGTLVFYMGVRSLADIAKRLIDAGRRADEPAAVIQQGTTTSQRTVTGTLADIAERASAAAIKPPALTVIGDVVAERERIEWFEDRPLLGRKVVVTRARSQAGRLGRLLVGLGAEVIEAPAIRTQARLDAAVRHAAGQIGTYELVCCTSQNGVEALFAALADAGLDARALSGAKVGAVGRATAEAFAAHGITADFVPDRATAEGLLDLLAGQDWGGRSVLLAVAANARPVLREGLEERMASVDEIAFYDTIVEPLPEQTIEAIRDADIVTFASGSAVHSTVEALGGPADLAASGERDGPTIVSIGPTTSATLREHGLEPAAEADEASVEGLVAKVLELAAR
jgi:uroporphyrinogen III methyltransferase/synthase